MGPILGCLAAISMAGCSTSAQGRNIAGVRNFQTGQYQQAVQNFQKALAAEPNNADAYYNLAAAYYSLGKQNQDNQLLNQAEGLYHQCLDLEPNHSDCHRGLAALLVDTNRSDSAFTLLQRWAERSPDVPDARIELARLHEEFGDGENAARHLTDALHLDPNNTRAWLAMGHLRENQGMIAQALSNYQQAYQRNQLQPGLSERIASLQQRLATAGNGYSAATTRMVNAPSPIPR